MGTPSNASSVLDEAISDLDRVRSRKDLCEFLERWRLEEVRDEVDAIHIDAYLAKLADLIARPSEHLRPGASGEKPQPTWRWFGEVLLRAAKDDG